MRDMIKSLQGDFQDKINAKETEIERIRNSKNRNNYNQEELLKQLKAFRYHFEKLEFVLRSIENDCASLEQIWCLHDILEGFLRSDEIDEQEIELNYKELNLPSKSLQHFPMLNEEENEAQKKIAAKKLESKPISNTALKPEPKPVEKG